MKTSNPLNQPPDVLIVDRKVFVLRSPYVYQWTLETGSGDGRAVHNRITVPTGFRWDGASVPKIFWRLGFRPSGKYNAASLIHDLLYLHRGQLPDGMFEARIGHGPWHDQSGSFLRRDVDRLFGKMMREAGVKPFKRRMMYRFVHWFGWLYWRDGGDALAVAFIKLAMFISLLVLLILIYR